ncbi:hypothetical protein PS2_013987 [Malus domestica]
MWSSHPNRRISPTRNVCSTSAHRRARVSRHHDFSLDVVPFTYLGVPIFRGKPRRIHFQALVIRLRLACRVGKAQVLVSWKNTFDLFSPSLLDSWSLTNLNNLCNWTAIICNQNTKTATQIDLSNFSIIGTLTEFNFATFLSLTHFNLSGNIFVGPISPDIGNMKSLGSISSAFGKYSPYLHMLAFRTTPSLEYWHPNCVADFLLMELDGNQLTNNITSAFGTHPNLQLISLADNQCMGLLSPQWEECKEITTTCCNRKSELYIDPQCEREQLHRINPSESRKLVPQANDLTGLILVELAVGNLKGSTYLGNCHYLDLSSNSLSGAIPSNLEKLTRLNVFNVSHNLSQRKSHLHFQTSWSQEIQATPSANQNISELESFESMILQEELQSSQVVAVKRLNMSDSIDIPAINLRSFQNEIRTLTNLLSTIATIAARHYWYRQ